jgi:hypothetical protein
MKAIKWLAIAVVAYLGIVVAFEGLVMFMGARQAETGVQPGEAWIVITTTDAAGSHDTVIAGVEREGQLFVSANHWPRGWHTRAVANPEVEVTRAGEKKPYRAVPLDGEAREKIAASYVLPWPLRFLTGFPPRAYLRLDTR